MKTRKKQKRPVADPINPQAPRGVYSLCEAVADIAYIAGHRQLYSGDSRKDIHAFIAWAQDFEGIHMATDWDVDGDYMVEIEAFAEQKMDQHPVAERIPACEGYRRYGGVFTLGLPKWERCNKKAIVKLTVIQTGEPETEVCACMTCWREAVTNKDVNVTHAKPL